MKLAIIMELNCMYFKECKPHPRCAHADWEMCLGLGYI